MVRFYLLVGFEIRSRSGFIFVRRSRPTIGNTRRSWKFICWKVFLPSRANAKSPTLFRLVTVACSLLEVYRMCPMVLIAATTCLIGLRRDVLVSCDANLIRAEFTYWFFGVGTILNGWNSRNGSSLGSNFTIMAHAPAAIMSTQSTDKSPRPVKSGS